MPQTSAQKKALWLGVVAGLIRRGDEFLVGRRPEGHSLAGLWEFPGGKIERNEAPEVALARELREELGIEATIGPVRLAATHHYGESGILILFYDILFWKGEPRAIHHAELRWTHKSELLKLHLPEANQKLLPAIIRLD